MDEASSLRGTGDSSLRNSANKLGVSSQDALPANQILEFYRLSFPRRRESINTIILRGQIMTNSEKNADIVTAKKKSSLLEKKIGKLL